jgi:serine/threonine protein kinase
MRRHRTADLDPEAFGGRYTLLRRLAVGGMAEIFLARQAAMAGFEKEVVIKRLRSELAGDQRIVEMFLDEARIGALLNHPNIVHVYDVDEQGAIPYIAMEYIIGEELNELCRRGLSHKKFLPLEHAVELMRQAAAGMGYFHAKRSTDGAESLDIVHLDISPSNLLVTQDGFLKIIDFGIASSRGQRQHGDVLPGKLGYMSPEQAARKPVDHRSDLFSLGIVLYEITVGRRLFRGPAAEVVHRLTSASVEPPTFVRRDFPTALESIVMRLLEKHPDDRYQSAYDLADDLETFLRDAQLHSGPVRIARYLDALSAVAGGPRRPELVSETETRRHGSDEIDFDKDVFGTYAPAQWEDTEQPDADVAAALGMELDELRALRTPVPGRPPTQRPESIPPPVDDLDAPTVDTKPAPAAATPVDDGWDIEPDPVPAPLDAGLTERHEAPIMTPEEPPTVLDKRVPPAPYPQAAEAGALAARVAFASAALQPRVLPTAPSRTLAQRLPWILVGALGVAVAALVAYIVR